MQSITDNMLAVREMWEFHTGGPATIVAFALLALEETETDMFIALINRLVHLRNQATGTANKNAPSGEDPTLHLELGQVWPLEAARRHKCSRCALEALLASAFENVCEDAAELKKNARRPLASALAEYVDLVEIICSALAGDFLQVDLDKIAREQRHQLVQRLAALAANGDSQLCDIAELCAICD